AAVEGLGGVRGKPVEHVAARAVLLEDVPDGLALARETGGGADRAGFFVNLGEAVDAVLRGALAGGNAVPQDGRERGLESVEIARDAGGDEVLEGGQL